MKLCSVLRRKVFPLILTYLIVSILCCLTVPILDYLTVPMVAGSEETLVTMSVYDMQSYFGDDLVVDVYINVTEPTTIIGWEINVKVNPEVLAPGYYYGGITYLAAAEDPGYFLYDWAQENPINYTIFSDGIPDNETGTITAISQSVQGWREMPGVGADTDGLWEKLVTLYFTQLNATPAYSPILLTEAWYSTSMKAPADDTHEANVINGDFGTPIHDVATKSVEPDVPSVVRGIPVTISVETFNLGGYNETFTVTAYYNKTATEWEPIRSETFTLTPLETLKEDLWPDWGTECVEPGNYTIKAVHNLTDANLDNNNATTTIEITRPEWDVAVPAISAPSEATAGDSVNINVTVANEGTKPITNVTVTAYYDGTIGTQNFTEPDVLAYGETIDLTFEWDTTGVPPENYTIEAVATVPSELNATPVSEMVGYNNNATTEVEIKIPDFNGNGVVDAVDLFLFAKAYGAPPNAGVIDLYVNADDETKTDWTRVGTNPYLNAIDYTTNYVHVTGKPNLVGDFGFEDSGKTIESISSVTVQLYAQQSGSGRELEVFVWDGSSWTSLGTQIVSQSSWGWMTWTATTVLDTWTKIDGAKIYIGTLNAGLYEVDCGRLQVDYVMHEPADLDYDGDVDSDDLDLFLENYGKST